uniref:Dynein regulatory complex protein 1 n=1 Tax=Ciona savignyi TaxID=51511 RepID=H2ZM38_CIOSA
ENMFSPEDEQNSGPSVDSIDPEERIRARRERIKRRVEQMKREALGEDATVEKETSSDVGRGKEQVELSRTRLEKLRNDGLELVTNVKVAGDAREMQHRIQEGEHRHTRVEKLEAESKTSSEKFDDISRRWVATEMKEVPHDLHQMLVEQTQACDAVVDEKNNLINQLQMELKQKDDEYVKDLKKQSEDVDLMIERMEEQVKNLNKSYRDELIQIENSFLEERSMVLKNSRGKWDSTMAQRREREEEYLKMRFKRVEDHESQLDSLRTHDTEEYNMVKIKLETDVQILEQQLQQMKATYQLNQEKLEYNFQVLKKRDEENTITKSQQKRKITRLQDTLNSFRLKLGKQEKHYKEENQSLVDEYKRIADQYKELHKKMKHFSATDWKKFESIWVMNEEEVKSLVKQALKADQTIHEQQLGLQWHSPDVSLQLSGPLQSQQKATTASAHDYAREIVAAATSNMASTDESQAKTTTSQLSLGAVKQLLEVLCDEGGFLMEEKLNKLLQPLQSEERSLIRLDAIFKALNIDTEEDVNKLSNFFHERFGPLSAQNGKFFNATVHPNEVLQILKDFVTEHIKPMRQKSVVRNSNLEMSGRDASNDAAYWESLASVIDDRKLDMWDALIDAFTKYHSVLTERANKIQETDGLRQQNAELRMLLHRYISSKVNQELEIPPTRVLQLEYS